MHFRNSGLSHDLGVDLIAAPTDDARTLIGELNEELEALYTPEQRHGLSLEALFLPHIRFFIARHRGGPAGCGGIALLDDCAEIKRLYVRPQLRGQGIAEAIMDRLAQEAVASGRNLLRLETGSHSFAAMRFYSRLGFQPCGAFAGYATMPPAAVIDSVFLEKRLLSER